MGKERSAGVKSVGWGVMWLSLEHACRSVRLEEGPCPRDVFERVGGLNVRGEV